MSRRDSPLYNFIMDALMSNKYPAILYWINKDEGIFCLKCLCKSKRGWNPSHSKIFDDYHKLKPRKSNDRRQRFLVAMRHCPFIEPLDDISTKEEKFYKFRAHGTLSVNATDEIAALSALNLRDKMEEIPPVPAAQSGPPIANATEDVEMEEIAAVWTAESGPPTGNTSMEDNACNSQHGNDLGSGLSPMETESNCSPSDVLNEELRSDIDELLERISSAAVPDGTADDLGLDEIGFSSSLYDSSDSVRSFPSCSQALDTSELFNLQEEEVSYNFEVREENVHVPSDYDPAKDFLESMRAPKAAAVNPSTAAEADPAQLGSALMLPGTSGEPSNCQSSVKVVKLDDNDEIAKSLRGDNVEKKFYMMVLIPKSM